MFSFRMQILIACLFYLDCGCNQGIFASEVKAGVTKNVTSLVLIEFSGLIK